MFETLLGGTTLGEDYFPISEKLDLFLGRFNSTLEGKLFAILDEISTCIGNHKVNNLLKSFATHLFINIIILNVKEWNLIQFQGIVTRCCLLTKKHL